MKNKEKTFFDGLEMAADLLESIADEMDSVDCGYKPKHRFPGMPIDGDCDSKAVRHLAGCIMDKRCIMLAIDRYANKNKASGITVSPDENNGGDDCA